MKAAWGEFRAKKLGKVVGTSVYIHASLEPELPKAWQELLATARAVAGEEAQAANLIRIETNGKTVSLMTYPGFFDEAFPRLNKSWAIKIQELTSKSTDYSARTNPPILHRKELLLPKNHERREEFEALTRQAENQDLFREANKIGTARAWEQRIEEAGLRLEGHTLHHVEDRAKPPPINAASSEVGEHALTSSSAVTAQTDSMEVLAEPSNAPWSPPLEVQRHRTAMQRYALSSPMQALWRHGFLEGHQSIFDYGCGRGDDIRILGESGIVVNGWDPHFLPDAEKTDSAVVNLGFVLNVIEDLQERQQALKSAFELAGKLLSVAVILGGRTALERHESFADGVLTSRGTFQKYFDQSELKEYIEEVLGREPIAAGPGVFFVFKSDEAEQEFLASKQSAWRALPQSNLRPEDRPRATRPRRLSKWDENYELIHRYWSSCLRLGRMATVAEFADSTVLRENVGSLKTIFNRLTRDEGSAPLEEAKQSRMQDLLVYLALNLFERRKSFKSLPDSLKRDITNFFGAYSRAVEQAKALLYSVADTAVIGAGCKEAVDRGLAYLEEGHSIQLHSSVVPRLSPALRVYVGCASRLYGDVETSDIVKVHIGSGKLSVMTYEGFEKAVPRLVERVKINLRAQRIDFFEYDKSQPEQLLYMKSRYLPPDFEGKEAQEKFDKSLAALKLFDFSDFGPIGETFYAILETRGYFIRGQKLCKRRSG